ncbi:MAG: UDP-3-O-(3-hydroxymyristoyl)glucosamine N-acyltransferase [Gammaproteobacteria bacterium]|nr:MAG: UDP-3-O-(3-hydroxymyristoyl)glucosamine N-acyltransferase [Gammaproteobacteria bacterium]
MCGYSLHDICKILSLDFVGDGNIKLKCLLPIDRAYEKSITFVSEKKHIKKIFNTKAGVIIINPKWLIKKIDKNFIYSDDPYLTFARVQQLFNPQPEANGIIHPSCTIGENCKIDKKTQIGAGTVIAKDIKIGKNSIIGSNTSIGERVSIGKNCLFYDNVAIYHNCVIGDNVIIHAGTVIGADGFGYARDKKNNQWVKIPQVGRVVINNNVEIGSNTTIDRGALDDTIIGAGVILDNQIQIGHNVVIGEQTAIAGCTGIAGSTIIGKNCAIGGAVEIVGHINITDNVILYAGCRVTGSIKKAGIYNSGTLHQPHNIWARNAIKFKTFWSHK